LWLSLVGFSFAGLSCKFFGKNVMGGDEIDVILLVFVIHVIVTYLAIFIINSTTDFVFLSGLKISLNVSKR